MLVDPVDNDGWGGRAFSIEAVRRFFEFRHVSYKKPQHIGEPCSLLATNPDCRLFIAEFDDQGIAFAPDLISKLSDVLDLLETKRPIIIVFAHGWRHNANAEDNNLGRFKEIILRIRMQPECGGRPILGVFVAWRGLLFAGGPIAEVPTIWNRTRAAGRVAVGSARELLGRLKAFRNAPSKDGTRASATLIIVGHSLGGLIVYTAIAQSLIEAASVQKTVVPSYGDLVVLVNPAFPAIAYLPIHEIVQRSDYDPDQLPVFISVTAENDTATKNAFRLASAYTLVTSAWRLKEERKSLINTMGHLEFLRTHTLSEPVLPQPSAPPEGSNVTASAVSHREKGEILRRLSRGPDDNPPNHPLVFGGVTVTREPDRKTSPFWVARATHDVVDGHNNIFKPCFLKFIEDLVVSIVVASPANRP